MPESVTIQIPADSTHCSQCGAEYRNIQHPMKPLGVIIQRLCDCVITTHQVGATTITTLTPPEKK